MAVAVLAGGGDASAPWCVLGVSGCRAWCRGLTLPGIAQCTNCRDLCSRQNCSNLQEMLLEANWLKSRASPATNHQCKKLACISAAPSFMHYKIVLKRGHWDPGFTYSKLPLHTVRKCWEWRTGRHSWKKLYQGTLTGSMDYSTGCKSDRHHGYSWDDWNLLSRPVRVKLVWQMFSFTPLCHSSDFSIDVSTVRTAL